MFILSENNPVEASGQSMPLKLDSKTEVVVQTAQSDQHLLDRLDQAEAVLGIRQGLASMERGEGRPAEEVFEDIRRRHQIPRAV